MNPFDDNSSSSTPAPTPLDDSMTPSWLKETPVPLENDTHSTSKDSAEADGKPSKLGAFHFRGSGVGFLIFAALIAAAVISAIAVFVFTCIQFQSTTTTKGGYALVSLTSGQKPCDSVLDKPLRFKFEDDSSGQYITCPWSTKNQLARLGFCIIAVLSVVIPIFGVKKSKRWVVIIFAGWSLLIALAFGYSFVIDVNDVRISSNWCNDGLTGIIFQPPNTPIKCAYWPFILTAILDLAAIIHWVALGLFTIRYVRRYMKPSFEQL